MVFSGHEQEVPAISGHAQNYQVVPGHAQKSFIGDLDVEQGGVITITQIYLLSIKCKKQMKNVEPCFH